MGIDRAKTGQGPRLPDGRLAVKQAVRHVPTPFSRPHALVSSHVSIPTHAGGHRRSAVRIAPSGNDLDGRMMTMAARDILRRLLSALAD